MKNTSKKQRVSGEMEDARRVGLAIRRIRRQRRMKQAELAALVDMQPAQLCNSEKGNNLPSLRTLRRICDALGVTVNDLLYPSSFLDMNRRLSIAQADSGTPAVEHEPLEEAGMIAYHMHPADKLYEPLETCGIARCTHSAEDNNTINEQVIAMLQNRITDYMALENLCGVSKRATIPLNIPFSVDSDGAEQLAAMIRMHCGIGVAVVFDYIEMLENNGLRVIFANLPEKIESLSFFDAINTNAFIVVSESLSPERQLFKIMFELANIFLYTRNDDTIVHDTDANRHFAKHFAAVMLMPREAVLGTVVQLGVLPEQWTYDYLLRIKSRFGVSAEAFAYRLFELNLLPKDGSLLSALIKQINSHYGKTRYGEPGEKCRHLSKNARFTDLLLCAKLDPENAEEVKKISTRFTKHYPIDIRIPISVPVQKLVVKKARGKRGRPRKDVRK